MKAALQDEHKSDLEGQLLLAEIRHEKEMEELRKSSSGSGVKTADEKTPSAGRTRGGGIAYDTPRATARRVLTSTEGTDTAVEPHDLRSCASDSPPKSPPREISRTRMPIGSINKGVKVEGSRQSRLFGKLPTFRTPTQKAALEDFKTGMPT